jgi:hypothetical protein
MGSRSKKKTTETNTEKKLLRLDIGCGPHKRNDGEWIGIDSIAFPGVDIVQDALSYLKTLDNESVSEINMSHFLEHIDGINRPPLMNEIYRVLITKGKVTITSPAWSHERAYGDPTHRWPPVTTWSFFYMNKAWRDINAPHCGYDCDFDWSVVGTYDQNDPFINGRNDETKMLLMSRNINVTTDIIGTLSKK